MFEIIFLGTSASAPSVYRGLSSQVVMVKDYRFMVDCGEGTQRQILRSGIGFKKLNRFLITHGHLDHVLGLAGLLSTLIRWESLEEVEIYGSRWSLDRVRDLVFGIVLRAETPPVPIHLIDITSGIIFEDKDFEISAFPVSHRGPGCLGYVFQEKPRRTFFADRADEIGIPQGPERAQLVRGETITLGDGRVVHPDEVLGPDVPGARLAITGDIGQPDAAIPHLQQPHALVTEATYLEVDRDLAAQFGHLTAAGAARLAQNAGARTLILTHISRRSREREILNEARDIFPNTFVARDFDRFQVSKNAPVSRIWPDNGARFAGPQQPDAEPIGDADDALPDEPTDDLPTDAADR